MIIAQQSADRWGTHGELKINRIHVELFTWSHAFNKSRELCIDSSDMLSYLRFSSPISVIHSPTYEILHFDSQVFGKNFQISPNGIFNPHPVFVDSFIVNSFSTVQSYHSNRFKFRYHIKWFCLDDFIFPTSRRKAASTTVPELTGDETFRPIDPNSSLCRVSSMWKWYANYPYISFIRNAQPYWLHMCELRTRPMKSRIAQCFHIEICWQDPAK